MRIARHVLNGLASAMLAAGCLAPGLLRAAERPTPSGLPVPRYVSLKFDKVNARAGPGDDNRLLFVYQAKGLPLQVVAETSEWRRVCDPQGAVAWVHRRTTDGRRTVMNTTAAAVALLRKPKDGASPAAYLKPQALASLVRCDKDWCRVRADGASGWARRGALWGEADTPQCH